MIVISLMPPYAQFLAPPLKASMPTCAERRVGILAATNFVLLSPRTKPTWIIHMRVLVDVWQAVADGHTCRQAGMSFRDSICVAFSRPHAEALARVTEHHDCWRLQP
jgi:hypothetical protein